MGMTIEDYINIIKNWLYRGTNGLTNTELGYMEGWFHKTDKEAFETAIEIMCKYQKLNKLKQECPFRTENSECNCTNEDCFIDDISDMCPFPKADYETRLKADMVAMLTEIQLEIEELRLDRPLMSRGYECYGFEDKTPTEIKKECSDVIQQKIDSIKMN